MLEVRQLCICWEGNPLVDQVTFAMAPGEVTLLLGSNGAGKSTLISAIVGLYPVGGGQVIWEGRDVTRLPLHARDGIALVPEGRQVAPSLTVEETLRLGAGRRPLRPSIGEMLERFPILADKRHQPAGTLSGGEAQILSLARALMARPRLLILDEPTLGLSPAAARTMFDILKRLRDDGVSMLLTDQDSRAASALATRAFTLAVGRFCPVPTAENQPAFEETT